MAGLKRRFDYLRLSLEDGDVASGNSNESQSIESQRKCCRQFRAEYPDLMDGFEEIVDDGYSGTHFDRPGIKRLLRLVELDMVEVIVVRDLSRFARNFLEAGSYMEFVFPAHGVRFISINDGYDSALYTDSSAALHIAIKNLVNQMYSRDISKKIKSAVDLKKMRGEFVYGTAPYGYKKGAKKNTIEVDPIAAPTVFRLFSMACNGKTITEIARTFNEEKIPTPSMHLSAVRSKKVKVYPIWSFESVRNILTNRIYTGDTVPFKSHVVRIGSDNVKYIPEEERIIIPNTHEAIITREMYEKAQLVIKSTKKSPSSGVRSPLATYLVCSCCGNRLQKGKPTNKTFLCATARYAPDKECKQIRCDDRKMQEILLKAVRQQCMMMDTRIKHIKATAKTVRSEIEMLMADIRLQRRLAENAKASKMRLYEEYVEGVITKEEYSAKKVELAEQEQTALKQLELLEANLAVLNSNVDDKDEVVESQALIDKYLEITELTEPLMRELFKKIIVYPDGSINIVWNFRDMTDGTKTTTVI